jgi:hypothetical protein
MNNWCTCWFFTHIFTGILIFKGLAARRLYKSFGVKGLIEKSAQIPVMEFGRYFVLKYYYLVDRDRVIVSCISFWHKKLVIILYFFVIVMTLNTVRTWLIMICDVEVDGCAD